jgi:hypothetical protein
MHPPQPPQPIPPPGQPKKDWTWILWPIGVTVALGAAIGWADSNDLSPVGVFVALVVVGVPLAFIILVVRALVRVGDKRPAPVVIQQTQQSTTPPPGFYLDPSGVNRWWDGQRWTEHVQQRQH